jgi:hypothetical protein
MLRNFFNKIKQERFLNKKAEDFYSSGFDAAVFKPDFLIMTIAFSNANVIRHQVRLLNKNVTDKFTHVIIDNSDIEEQSRKIEMVCREFDRPYIKLRGNFHGRGSNSHALALNWAYRQLVLRYKPDYFGFLDHDIYPIAPESIITKLEKQQVYGHLQYRENYWYLWAGLCFFKRTELFTKESDFAAGPVNGVNLDTGGMLYKTVFSKLDKSKIEFPEQRYERLREGELVQSDQVEYIGNWMHSFNGSYWIEIKDKEKELEDLINQYCQ